MTNVIDQTETEDLKNRLLMIVKSFSTNLYTLYKIFAPITDLVRMIFACRGLTLPDIHVREEQFIAAKKEIFNVNHDPNIFPAFFSGCTFLYKKFVNLQLVERLWLNMPQTENDSWPVRVYNMFMKPHPIYAAAAAQETKAIFAIETYRQRFSKNALIPGVTTA